MSANAEGFYRRALKSSLSEAQYRDLLVSASEEIFRLRAVLDSLPYGILVCDEGHALTLANKAARRLLPLSHAEGALLWDSVLNGDLSAFFKKALETGERALEHEQEVSARGRDSLLSISVHPLVDGRKISGSLVHVQDITERRARDQRLRRAENLASLTTLAAGVAHEIKNPLGAISIHLQLMQKALGASAAAGRAGDVFSDAKKRRASDKGEKSRPTETMLDKYFGILNQEVDRLNQIVVDFLLSVRPMTLDLRPGSLNAIVRELAEFVGKDMERSGVTLVLDLDDGLPLALIDERYIKNALLNLVGNAQAAMPEGGLLTISTFEKDGCARVSVRDTGAGIESESLDKIFEPYYTTKDSGTGLGLTIVYKIIREHKGDIAVESSQGGGGTSFEISIPSCENKMRFLSYESKDSE
ncbi:MAG: ATP-binding protein [Treponema sp.]|nr:ATP-binding protein [Treponema sp.]